MHKSEELLKSISKKLKVARKMKKLSQAKVAEEAEIAWSHYGHIEKSDCFPSVYVLYKLANILDIPFENFITNDNKNEQRIIAKTMIDKLDNNDFEYVTTLMNKMLEK